MTELALKSLFQQKYNQQNWKEILSGIFTKAEYFTSPNILVEKEEEIKFVRQIGNISISDGNIGIFEVEISNKIVIARSRVKLRELTAKYIDQDKIHGAFVFYYSPKQNDYRFTFIAKKNTLSDEGELVKYQTPAKRYTYVLGPNESCTTAAKRFLELSSKENILFENIIQAFSVEKLTKEFFKKYKEHYEHFCDTLAISQYRKSVFNIPHHKDKKENSNAEKPIRDFVKLLLGRIVFLHFLQKKGWLGCSAGNNNWEEGDPHFLNNLFLGFKEKNLYLSKCLNKLFFDTLNTKREDDIFAITQTRVPYLNGGLFDNLHPEYNQINFPSNFFEELFDFFSQYNFTIDENSPDEHEVGIDPEMLGHIFENLLEDNKDKGAFYTPKEIVHYMCHESLIQYLKTHLSPLETDKEQFLESFIHNQELSQFIRDNAKEIDSLLNKVKICDPAIGSGAFPMGLLKEIFQAKLLLYPYLKTNKRFDPAVVKRNIIQNSIYGVDLDSGAVDIARLRFWLSLVVDEEEPTPLPNLDYKIMQGNSLLESFEGTDLSIAFTEDKFKITFVDPQIDIFTNNVENPQYQVNFTDEQKAVIKDLTEKYFKETDKSEKLKLHNIIESQVLDHILLNLEFDKNKQTILLNETKHELKGRLSSVYKLSARKQYLTKNKLLLRIEQLRKELKEIDSKYLKLKALEETTERPYFLWHFYFKEVFDNGGFDIVIGNPPYGATFSAEQKKYFQNHYESAKTTPGELKGSLDSFSVFTDKGLNLCGHNACLTYIVPLAITSSESMMALHNIFFKTCETIRISTYSNRPHKIFESADQRVAIIILEKNNKPTKNVFTTKVNKRYRDVSTQELIDNLHYVNSKDYLLKGRIPKVGSQIELNILSKLFAIKTKLADLIDEQGKEVYYRAAGGRYYNIVTNFVSGSSQEKPILIQSGYQNLIAAILSSSLYYWFLHIFSDTLHIKSYELEIMPIPIDKFNDSKINAVEKIYNDYLKDLEKNARIIEANYNNVSGFKEYRARKSKHLIDKIDLALKEAYGLTDEEIKFIINYDLEFRTDEEE